MRDPHSTFTHALGLLSRGLSIIPVNTGLSRPKKPHFHALHGTGHSVPEQRQGKVINVPTWKEFQQTPATEDELRAWVYRFGVRGFALVTGALSGVVGIDFDADGLDALARLGWQPHVKTPGGGSHVYVKHPGWRVKTIKASGITRPDLMLPAGIDVRGDGGYIVLPPTEIEDYGAYVRTPVRAFMGVEAIPLTFMDGERECALREVLGLTPPKPPCRVVRPAHSPASPTYMSDAGQGGQGYDHTEGDRRASIGAILDRAADTANAGLGRNESAFWLGCQMRDNGYSEFETLTLYPDVAARFPQYNTKGFPDEFTSEEFTQTIRSVFTQAPRGKWRSSQPA